MEECNRNVLCIKNAKHKTNLTLGNIYRILGIDKTYFYLKNDSVIVARYRISYFITGIQYRRYKILKLKERICLKSVIG